MLVNVVDVPPLCNFILPAIVRSGPLAIAISTAGASPALAKRMKREIAEQFGEPYARLAVMLNDARGWAKATLPTFQDRKEFFEAIVNGEPDPIALLRDGDERRGARADRGRQARQSPRAERAGLTAAAGPLCKLRGARGRQDHARLGDRHDRRRAANGRCLVHSRDAQPARCTRLDAQATDTSQATTIRPNLLQTSAADRPLLACRGTRLPARAAVRRSAPRRDRDRLNVADFFGTPAVIAQLHRCASELPGWVRVFLGWQGSSPTQGIYNTAEIADYHALLRGAARPARRSTSTSSARRRGPTAARRDPRTPPTNDADYAAFLNYLANAFHGDVSAWEIWNEEDSTGWWTGIAGAVRRPAQGRLPGDQVRRPHRDRDARRPRPATTAPTCAALRRRRPAAPSTRSACTPTTPATSPRPTSFDFDPGTQHDQPVLSFLGFISVHDAMVANGDGAHADLHDRVRLVLDRRRAPAPAAPGPARSPPASAEQTQATYLQQAYHCLAQPQYSYVAAAMWFDMVDFAPQNVFYNRYGLLSTALKPKPAFNAFRAGRDQPATSCRERCGNFAGPTLHLITPTNGERYSGRAAGRASAARQTAALSRRSRSSTMATAS